MGDEAIVDENVQRISGRTIEFSEPVTITCVKRSRPGTASPEGRCTDSSGTFPTSVRQCSAGR